jgi:hypothetical protein
MPAQKQLRKFQSVCGTTNIMLKDKTGRTQNKKTAMQKIY